MKIRYLILLSLLFILSMQARIARAEIITAFCPAPSELTRTTLTNSWANYHYTGHVSVNLAEVNNQLTFEGNSNADKVNYFYGATWTDRTFLCLYNYNDDAIVTYEGQLDPYVNRCYFGTPGQSECISSNPQSCAISCEYAIDKQSAN